MDKYLREEQIKDLDGYQYLRLGFLAIRKGIYQHSETKHRYKVLSLGRMKNPNTKEWEIAVFYTHEDGGGSYCRDVLDFEKTFDSLVI